MAHPPSFSLRAIFVPEDFVDDALFSSVSIVPFLLHWTTEIPSVEHARAAAEPAVRRKFPTAQYGTSLHERRPNLDYYGK